MTAQEQCGPSWSQTLDLYIKICTKEIGVEPSKGLLSTLPGADDDPNPRAISFCGRCGPGGMHALLKAIQGEGRDGAVPYSILEELRIEEGCIQDAGLMHIARLLEAKDVALTAVAIQGDRITKVGCDSMTIGLITNRSLQELRLDYCEGLDDRAVKSLVNGVGLHPYLMTLSLKFCSFGPLGARYLGRMLSKCAPGESALSRLYVQGNCILPEGLEALATGIASTVTLIELDLRGCEVGDPYAPSQFETTRVAVDGAFQALSEALEQNKLRCDEMASTGDFENIRHLESVR